MTKNASPVLFNVKWKRGLFWHTVRGCDGLKLTDCDRLILTFPDGSIEEIPEWSKCRCRLGRDWFLAQKNSKELEVGHAIPTTK